jgi:uncharacterized protein (TIGR03437 family)
MDTGVMKQLKSLAVIGLLASAGAWAQGVSQITVGMTQPGAAFLVDGVTYSSTQVFNWPTGSKHTLQFLYSIDPNTGLQQGFQGANSGTVEYFFTGWVDSTGALSQNGASIISITASPSLTSMIGNVTLEYEVTVTFYDSPGAATCNGAPGDAPTDGWRYGIVFVDNVCVTTSTALYLTPGNHTFNAFAFPGFSFVNWYIDGNAPNGAFLSYNVTHAVTVVPNFQPAKRVSFRTNPPNLNLIVDHTLINPQPGLPVNPLPSVNFSASCTPNYAAIPGGAPAGFTPLCTGDFDFLPGSAHQIGAPQSQQDNRGNWWVFSNFSDGVPNGGTYVTPNNVGTPDDVTATFVPGAYVIFMTNPPGLSLSVDGRTNWQGYSFVWGQGETHTVSAPATNTDSQGRQYQFVGWSNKGAASQTVLVPSDGSQVTLTATYQMLGQIQVTTNPPGLAVNVNGAPCPMPCVLNQLAGSQVQVTAPASIPYTQLSRYEFDSWAGSAGSGTSNSLSLTFTTGSAAITASYHTSWELLTASNPANQAQFKFNPPSPDGFFADGTQVSITVVPNAGYKFTAWGGDLAGVFTTSYLTMNAPHSVTAVLATAPYIAPAGVVNAASNMPGPIGPGSIMSIYGQNLAPSLVVGPVSPLAQTLGGLTVTVGNYLLPLLFVSPQQINAQVPVELADGNYTVAVHIPGQPDVSANFTVQRDSPGVFTQSNPQGMPLVLALHADGTPVTPDSPARRHETISIFGTGFGPYSQTPVDGFLVPMGSVWPLADTATIVAGNLTLTPSWAGAAQGMVGTGVVQLNIDDTVPTATTLNMQLSVNGVSSNAVQLPVQ